MNHAKLLIEVTASVMPPEVKMLEGETPLHVQIDPEGWQRSRPDPHYTKIFPVTSEEWELAKDTRRLLNERNAEALAYAAELMARPAEFNHVRVDWLWL